MLTDESNYENILEDLISIVENTKNQVAIQANSSLTIMFWQIGKRIQSDILENNRAEYGKEIVVSLSRELTNLKLNTKDKWNCI
jgi:hypothetical protein